MTRRTAVLKNYRIKWMGIFTRYSWTTDPLFPFHQKLILLQGFHQSWISTYQVDNSASVISS